MMEPSQIICLLLMLLLTAIAFRMNRWFGLLCLGVTLVFVVILIVALGGARPIRNWIMPMV